VWRTSPSRPWPAAPQAPRRARFPGGIEIQIQAMFGRFAGVDDAASGFGPCPAHTALSCCCCITVFLAWPSLSPKNLASFQLVRVMTRRRPSGFGRSFLLDKWRVPPNSRTSTVPASTRGSPHRPASSAHRPSGARMSPCRGHSNVVGSLPGHRPTQPVQSCSSHLRIRNCVQLRRPVAVRLSTVPEV